MDLETTGLDSRKDSTVSYGAVMIDGRSTRYSLVQPDRALEVESIGVHCLRDVDLGGCSQRGHIIAGAIAELLDGRVLVGHAAWVE